MSENKIKGSYSEKNVQCYIFDSKENPNQDVVACITESESHVVPDLALRKVALNALKLKGGYDGKDVVEIVPGGKKGNAVMISKLSADEILKKDLKPGKFNSLFMYAQKVKK